MSDTITRERSEAMISKMLSAQREFQRRVFPKTWDSDEQRYAVTKELVLGLISEADELLRQTKWKTHRRPNDFQLNRAALRHEIGDIFKYLLAIATTWDMDTEALEQAFWEKTMVCEQRWSEEHLLDLTDIAVVDLDNVLADYIAGFLTWARREIPVLLGGSAIKRSMEIDERMFNFLAEGRRDHMRAEVFGLVPAEWEALKHAYRVSGAKRKIPAFNDAAGFLSKLRTLGLQVVLLTSRPITRYPNIYQDTLAWLSENGMLHNVNAIWWSNDKFERIAVADLIPKVRLVVDDDPKFLDPFARQEVPCALVSRGFRQSEMPQRWSLLPGSVQPYVHEVANLDEISVQAVHKP